MNFLVEDGIIVTSAVLLQLNEEMTCNSTVWSAAVGSVTVVSLNKHSRHGQQENLPSALKIQT